MKKILSLTLAICITAAFSLTTVLAQPENKTKEKAAANVAVTAAPSLDELIKGHESDGEYIKGLIKQYHKDKETRKALLKKFVELQKAKNDDSMPIFVEGEKVETEVPPVIKGDRMLIPVRAVTNALGAEVLWNDDTRTVTVTKAVYGAVYGQETPESTIKIEIKLDSNIVYVNGVETEIDVPAQLVSNRTMVPLRFIAETFKKAVEWDEGSKSVLIDEDKEDEEIDEAEDEVNIVEDEEDTEQESTVKPGKNKRNQ